MYVKRFIKGNYNWEYLDASASKLVADVLLHNDEKNDWRLLRKRVSHSCSVPKTESDKLGYMFGRCSTFSFFKFKFAVMRISIILLNEQYTKTKVCSKLALTFYCKRRPKNVKNKQGGVK